MTSSARAWAENPDTYVDLFYVPRQARWDAIKKLVGDAGTGQLLLSFGTVAATMLGVRPVTSPGHEIATSSLLEHSVMRPSPSSGPSQHPPRNSAGRPHGHHAKRHRRTTWWAASAAGGLWGRPTPGDGSQRPHPEQADLGAHTLQEVVNVAVDVPLPAGLKHDARGHTGLLSPPLWQSHAADGRPVYPA